MDCIVMILVSLAMAAPSPGGTKPPSIQDILSQVQTAGRRLNSYQARIEYVLTQPLLDSRTVRTGAIYYQRSTGSSRLRVSMQTIQQDQDKPQSCHEEFIFDGVWLTHIDYQLMSITKRQMTEPNQPKDAFELAGSQFPIIGFTDINELIGQFDVRLAGPDPNDRKTGLCQLEFTSRPGSRYSQQYHRIIFTIQTSSWLPAKVYAESSEGDLYEVSFLQPRINQALDPGIFDVSPPAHFGPPQIITLEHARKDAAPSGD